MSYDKKFYPNSGILMAAKKRNEKAPDLTGNIALGTDLVDYIMQQYEDGNREIFLDISAWKKVSRAGNNFLSVSVKKPYVKGDTGLGASSRPAAKQSFLDDDDDEDKIPF